MIPFTIDLEEDFKHYRNRQLLALGKYSKGYKTFEANTWIDDNDLKLTMRIVQTFTDTPGIEKIHLVSTLVKGIEKFNEII